MSDCHAPPDQPFPLAWKAFPDPNRVVWDVSEEVDLTGVTRERATE